MFPMTLMNINNLDLIIFSSVRLGIILAHFLDTSKDLLQFPSMIEFDVTGYLGHSYLIFHQVFLNCQADQ